MVAAIHYFATTADQSQLLDYLGEPVEVSLHPWPVMASTPLELSRDQALRAGQVMVAHRTLGPPTTIRPGSPAMASNTRAGVFNRLNWDRLQPAARDALVDSNASPVLLWMPAKHDQTTIRTSSIGSQADAMATISDEYERWVNRVMGWVRRRGTRSGASNKATCDLTSTSICPT